MPIRSDRLYCDYIRQEGVAAIRTVASTVITDSLRPVCVQYVRWQQQQQPEHSHGGGSQIKPTTAAHGKCFSEIRYAFHFQLLGKAKGGVIFLRKLEPCMKRPFPLCYYQCSSGT